MNQNDSPRHHMDLSGYVERVNFHLERLGVLSRPALDAYVEAWNNQIPARKMDETYKRRLNKVIDQGPANSA
jgi:hypothetical protein